MSAAFPLTGDANSRARLRDEMAHKGYCVVTPPEGLNARFAAENPWEAAGRVAGVEPLLVEQQPIAAVEWGKSYASTSRETPLHTDSQMWRGAPPHLQLMFCERAARDGGQSLLLDSFRLLETLETKDPALFHALFEETRTIPFVFGDAVGSTVSERGGSLVFTCSPRRDHDAIARRLSPWLDPSSCEEVEIEDGELLLVDNHRMLHGRRAFSDTSRRFVRLLVWLPVAPLAPPRFLARAAEVAARRRAELSGDPDELRRRGLAPPLTEASALRISAVIEMLRGTPPGALARRLGLPEPVLYRLRDAALCAIEREG